MPVIDAYEQHHLLVMIESMQREGRSEREIAAAVSDATRHQEPVARPASLVRPTARRLVRWTLARIWA